MNNFMLGLSVGCLVAFPWFFYETINSVTVCQQAYTAKVSQQIPTCKQWEDNINNMKEGK